MKKSKKKEARQARAIKKQTRKKIITIIVLVLIAVSAIAGWFLFSQDRSVSEVIAENDRVFADARQRIILLSDGTFSARLAHNSRRSGNWEEEADGNGVKVTFTYDNDKTATTRIENNVLLIPSEWSDRHGHNRSLRLQK